MATEFRTFEQLPPKAVVEGTDLLPIQTPGGPVESTPLSRLIGRLGPVDLVAETFAGLDLAHDAGTLAIVWGDPDPEKLGYHVKTGASGGGAWVHSEVFRGFSAYQIAVQNGFAGDLAAWLESLVGADGVDGGELPADPDGTMAANSDAVVPTQKAVRTYVAANAGAGGAATWDFNPPLAAGFATVSAGGAPLMTLADDGDVGLCFEGGAPSAGSLYRLATKAIPNPPADWTATLRMRTVIDGVNFSGYGLACLDSSTGKALHFVQTNNTNVEIYRLTNAGFSGEQVGGINFRVEWFRLRKRGANVEAWLSVDGRQWALLYTEPLATFILNNPDRIGFGVVYNRGLGTHLVGSVPYWLFTQP